MIWNPAISAGSNDLLYSGTVVINTNSSIKITPVPSVERPFYVQIVFNDSSTLPLAIAVSNTNDNGVIVTLTNFAVSGSSSTTTPATVGNYNGAPIHLSLAGYPIGSGQNLVRVISYSFYGKA
jgi:hypothetical protein